MLLNGSAHSPLGTMALIVPTMFALCNGSGQRMHFAQDKSLLECFMAALTNTSTKANAHRTRAKTYKQSTDYQGRFGHIFTQNVTWNLEKINLDLEGSGC